MASRRVAARASKTVQAEVMDACEAAFKRTPVLLRCPAGEGDYAHAPNSQRKLGYHDDSFAWATLETGRKNDDWFYRTALRKAGPAAMERWKTAPIGGAIRPELWPCLWKTEGCTKGQDFARSVRETHATWLTDSSTSRTLAPGERERALAAAQTWAGGGELRLELQDASGTPGVGWDLVNIGGSLSITADSAARFTLRLQTLSAGAPGLLAGFDAASPYAWKFLGVTGGSITSFASTDFAIDTTGFLNPLAGDFSVARTGNDLFLNYTPVPEPQAAVLAILGLAGFAVWRNRSVIAGRDHRD